MMESQNHKRAPAWTEREVRDLIAVWGEESVLSELRSSFRNAKTFVKISQGMKDRGHNRDPKQCRMKLKELRQAYERGNRPLQCRSHDGTRTREREKMGEVISFTGPASTEVDPMKDIISPLLSLYYSEIDKVCNLHSLYTDVTDYTSCKKAMGESKPIGEEKRLHDTVVG
ncbi:hypothetical protein UY3_00273 [Chelonia mydas]|uniref:Myb/SANT-like DNA-binding domain-containing protein n=1 Tax=Chelonia mydas TaxID=8469 RepID=M7BYY8_CHEMY|nr:hypothetical protein UY3_00273 [Chelonia mydas]